MLTGEHSLTYYPDTLADGTSTGPPDHIVIGYKQNNIEEDLIVKFDPDSDRIAFFETANRHLASAEFTIDKADTMLVFTNDSLPQKRMIFIKYDMNHCPHVPSYFHLVNDKFIAGKYFNANDTTLSHHIIFTKCGNVEGAENIATYITRGKSYEVKLAYFDDKGDKIIFRDSLDEGVAELFWSVNKDSLILISNTTNSKVKPIILLKK